MLREALESRSLIAVLNSEQRPVKTQEYDIVVICPISNIHVLRFEDRHYGRQ